MTDSNTAVSMGKRESKVVLLAKIRKRAREIRELEMGHCILRRGFSKPPKLSCSSIAYLRWFKYQQLSLLDELRPIARRCGRCNVRVAGDPSLYLPLQHYPDYDLGIYCDGCVRTLNAIRYSDIVPSLGW